MFPSNEGANSLSRVEFQQIGSWMQNAESTLDMVKLEAVTEAVIVSAKTSHDKHRPKAQNTSQEGEYHGTLQNWAQQPNKKDPWSFLTSASIQSK
jgi:hypothetical protein